MTKLLSGTYRPSKRLVAISVRAELHSESSVIAQFPLSAYRYIQRKSNVWLVV